MISFSRTYTIPLSWDLPGWFAWIPIAIILALVLFVYFNHSSQTLNAEEASDRKLESDLQLAISRSTASQSLPTWTAPKLPASVIASIWTSRLIASSPQAGSDPKRDPTAALRFTVWNYRRKAPYILTAAFLSLRDAGLIRLFVEPPRKLVSFNDRVRVERTDLAITGFDLPAVEGGLLLACLDIAHKRFGKTAQPSANAVVREWIHQSMSQPFQWVLGVATQQARELGLYEPVIKKRGFLMPEEKPVLSLDHLAACDDQVVAYAAHWQEIGVHEPELQRTLLTEVAFGIYTRQQRSA